MRSSATACGRPARARAPRAARRGSRRRPARASRRRRRRRASNAPVLVERALHVGAVDVGEQLLHAREQLAERAGRARGSWARRGTTSRPSSDATTSSCFTFSSSAISLHDVVARASRPRSSSAIARGSGWRTPSLASLRAAAAERHERARASAISASSASSIAAVVDRGPVGEVHRRVGAARGCGTSRRRGTGRTARAAARAS